MKSLILFFFLVVSHNLMAGTCTSISRTNNAANAVLTSTKYNLDNNTVYNFVNAYDAGCISSGTLESDALMSSQFGPVLNAITEGCEVTGSDSNTVSISACRAAVNGNFVATTIATTATWGCSGCSSEVASTSYYVYIKSDSSGTTLTPIISTTAPNANGYDGSSNKVLAKFRNNGDSNIETTNIGQFIKNKFIGFGSEVRVNTANGYGSTNNKIVRTTTIVEHLGDAITRASTAADGDSYTIGEEGIYTVAFATDGTGAMNLGISRNSNQLTTSVYTITAAHRLCNQNIGGNAGTCTWTGRLNVGDVIRPHTDGTSASTAALTQFTITKTGVEQ